LADVSRLASDLARLHRNLCVEDGDPEEPFDPMFEARIRRRLSKDDPVRVRQVRHIASEVSKLVSL